MIIDQVYGDRSISFGMASDNTFEFMLKAAKRENPGAQIIIKTHPVANKGHFCLYKNDEGLHFVDYDINPIALLEQVDKVYVCTSQMGFEALMCGKETRVFGMPYYAGWGITADEKKCHRRKKKRDIEEIFFAAYIMSTTYVSRKSNKICEIEQVIEELETARAEYFRECS